MFPILICHSMLLHPFTDERDIRNLTSLIVLFLKIRKLKLNQVEPGPGLIT